MNQEFRDNWCAGLRSGKYTQKPGHLRTTEYVGGVEKVVGHCCLGVGCDIADPKGWDWFFESEDDFDISERTRDHRYSEYGLEELSREGLRAFGITSKIQSVLIDMNDAEPGSEHHRTFPQIADWIESNIPVTP